MSLAPYTYGELQLLLIDDLPGVFDEGGRHNGLKEVSKDLRNLGLDGNGIDEALQRVNIDRCNTPLPESEVSSIAEWAGETEIMKAIAPLEIPDNVLLLPNDHMDYPTAATKIYETIAKKHTMFLHGGTVSEKTPYGLKQVSAKAFPSRLDTYGKVQHLIKTRGGYILPKPTRCSMAVAGVLLECPEINLLPHLRALSPTPVITPDGKSLTKGYHSECGGILVEGGEVIEDIPLENAVKAILEIFAEFDFASEADKSRAVAMLLTIALKIGGFFKGPTPMDIAEADQSQAGKGYRQQVTGAVYNAVRTMVYQKKGGVGSTDESIASGLLLGGTFICLDNWRGECDSPMLESIMTEPQHVRVRTPYSRETTVDARAVTFQMTSNGVEITTDLARRASIIRIRKKPRGYKFKEYPEGDLLTHVATNQAFYLGCVFAVINEWIRRGRPLTDTTDHDMREWAQSLDYIVQEIMGLPPLMDGHIEIQERVSNPVMNWLRDIIDYFWVGSRYTASDFASASRTVGWPPGQEPEPGKENLRVGQIMARLFRAAGSEVIVTDDGWQVERTTEEVYNEKRQENMDMKLYAFSKPGEVERGGI